jgi:hypothetical protein
LRESQRELLGIEVVMPDELISATGSETLPSEPEPETLRMLYVENAKIVSTFLDWRHRVMTFTVTVCTALVAVAGWLFKEKQGVVSAMPLLIASLVAFLAIIFDERNQCILEDGYVKAREYGGQLHSDGGIFADIPVPGVTEVRKLRRALKKRPVWRRFWPKADPPEERWTYHFALARFYFILGVFFLGLAIWDVLHATL